MAKRGSAFCIVYCRSSCRFLMEHRGVNASNPLTYGFFGGGLERGETPEQACSRELQEETGRKIKGFDYAVKLKSKHPVHFFVKILRSEFTPVLSWESSGFRWVQDIEDVKPLHPKILRYYGEIRRLMEATRQAATENENA